VVNKRLCCYFDVFWQGGCNLGVPGSHEIGVVCLGIGGLVVVKDDKLLQANGYNVGHDRALDPGPKGCLGRNLWGSASVASCEGSLPLKQQPARGRKRHALRT
jgi:hypothetical protein